MDMVNVIEAPKEKFTWAGPLRKIEAIKEPIWFWYSDRMKIAPLISKDMKMEFPDREYETAKEVLGSVKLKKDLVYLKVWRNK